MADIVSSKAKINDVEVSAEAALSEALFEKMGGSINYLIDETDDNNTRLDTLESAKASTTSSSSGNFTTTSNSYVDVTNLTVTLTPSRSGKVFLTLYPASGASSYIRCNIPPSQVKTELRILKNGSPFLDLFVNYDFSETISVPDFSAGTSSVTYKVQAREQTASGTVTVLNYILSAHEI